MQGVVAPSIEVEEGHRDLQPETRYSQAEIDKTEVKWVALAGKFGAEPPDGVDPDSAAVRIQTIRRGQLARRAAQGKLEQWQIVDTQKQQDLMDAQRQEEAAEARRRIEEREAPTQLIAALYHSSLRGLGGHLGHLGWEPSSIELGYMAAPLLVGSELSRIDPTESTLDASAFSSNNNVPIKTVVCLLAPQFGLASTFATCATKRMVLMGRLSRLSTGGTKTETAPGSPLVYALQLIRNQRRRRRRRRWAQPNRPAG